MSKADGGRWMVDVGLWTVGNGRWTRDELRGELSNYHLFSLVTQSLISLLRIVSTG